MGIETYTLKAQGHEDSKVRSEDEAYKTPDCDAQFLIWKYTTEEQQERYLCESEREDIQILADVEELEKNQFGK